LQLDGAATTAAILSERHEAFRRSRLA